MKIKSIGFAVLLAAAAGLGAGLSTTASADYSCIRECRAQYQQCLSGCSNASCRTLCFYNYENCIDYNCTTP
jgi:hypothetical protein